MKTFYITILLSVAVAMPLWMAWCRSQNRPYLRYWVMSLLFTAPIVFVWLTQPELLSTGSNRLVQALTIFPLFVGLSAFFGGFVFILLSSNSALRNKSLPSIQVNRKRRNNDINRFYEPVNNNPWAYHWDWRW